eukprot:5978653-Prymnesium_polylepis.2
MPPSPSGNDISSLACESTSGMVVPAAMPSAAPIFATFSGRISGDCCGGGADVLIAAFAAPVSTLMRTCGRV